MWLSNLILNSTDQTDELTMCEVVAVVVIEEEKEVISYPANK